MFSTLSECIETIVYNILFIILGHIALSLTKSYFFYIIAFVGTILILTSIDFLSITSLNQIIDLNI